MKGVQGIPDSAEVITDSKIKQFFLRARTQLVKTVTALVIIAVAIPFFIIIVRYSVFVWNLLF